MISHSWAEQGLHFCLFLWRTLTKISSLAFLESTILNLMMSASHRQCTAQSWVLSVSRCSDVHEGTIHTSCSFSRLRPFINSAFIYGLKARTGVTEISIVNPCTNYLWNWPFWTFILNCRFFLNYWRNKTTLIVITFHIAFLRRLLSTMLFYHHTFEGTSILFVYALSVVLSSAIEINLFQIVAFLAFTF